MRTLIEASPNGISVVDDHGKVRLLNASAEKLLRYSRIELLGKCVEVLVPDRFVNAHEALRNAYMRIPKARPMAANLDLNGRRKNGTEVPTPDAEPVDSGFGMPMFLVCSFRVKCQRFHKPRHLRSNSARGSRARCAPLSQVKENRPKERIEKMAAADIRLWHGAASFVLNPDRPEPEFLGTPARQQGFLRLSLVTCPVALYSATS